MHKWTAGANGVPKWGKAAYPTFMEIGLDGVLIKRTTGWPRIN